MLNGIGGSADFLRNAKLSIMHTPSRFDPQYLCRRRFILIHFVVVALRGVIPLVLVVSFLSHRMSTKQVNSTFLWYRFDSWIDPRHRT